MVKRIRAWRCHAPTIGALMAVLALAGVLTFEGAEAATRWDKTERNVHIKGMMQVDDGAYLADSVRINNLTISDSLLADGDAKLGKSGAFVINADSTVTLTGNTTVGATTTFGKAGGFLMNTDSTNTVDGATTFGSTVTLNGTTTVGAAQVFGKAGGLLINADSTVTIDGATTVNAAASFTQPVTMDSLQVYALCGEYEMTADTDSITVAGLLTTDICLWNFSLTPIADFTVTCEAGQLKLAGTSASGSKVHYMVVRPGS